MANQFKGVRIYDADGNAYLFQCSLDTNVTSIKDVLLSSLEGISKFVGYKLVIDNVYKTVEDQILENQTAFNFYKKLKAFDGSQDITKEEFGKSLQEIIAKAKVSKINSMRVTSWHGEKVYSDTRGLYVKRSIPCCAYGCKNIITGIARLSLDSAGDVSRSQSFTPDDSRVQRYRQGSKKRLCPDCAVKYISPPIPPEITPDEHEEAPEEVENVSEGTSIGQNELTLESLTEICNDTTKSAEFVRGYLAAILKMECLK